METRLSLRKDIIAYLRAYAVSLPISHRLTLVVLAEGEDQRGGSRDLDNLLKGVMSALDDNANCLWPESEVALRR